MRQGSWIALIMLLGIIFFASNQRGQVAWTTITVSGGSSGGGDLEASLADTLNLVAGSNITLTSTPGTDTITITSAATASAAFVLDLGDDGTNESGALAEIATVGAGASTIFTEPSADKLLIDTGVAWPTATALAVNGANCTAGSFPLGVDASGASESCTAVNVFSTMDAPSGTDPAADSLTDILQLLVSGTDLSITGDSTTDSLTWDILTGAGTDITTDLEEETHASEHAVGAGDEVGFYGIVQDEASDLTQRRRLNFAGAGVSCADNAGSSRTDCTIGGGGAGNSFETIAVPSGTNPVADSSTDTLTLGVTGSDILIFGIASTDTINFDLLTHAGTDITVDLEEEAQIGNVNVSNSPGGANRTLVTESGSSVLWTLMPTCTGASAGTQVTNFDGSVGEYFCVNNEAFRTISGSGQTSGGPVVADANADTLTLSVTGSGSLSLDASTDTITIAMTGSLALQDEGLALAQRYTLDFLGAGVTCVDDATVEHTECTIPGGGTTNSFETIAGGGQATGGPVVADSATDTLTLAADTLGASWSLTAGSDTITLSVTGAGSRNAVILNPTTGETNKVQWQYARPATLDRVRCSTDVGTVTINLDKRGQTTPNTAGTNAMSTTMACDTNSEIVSSFSSASVATNEVLNLQITATTGSPTVVRIHVHHTE